MGKEFTANTPEEIRAALDDPNKIITQVSIEIENTNKDRSEKITEEGFEIPKDFIVGMYRKMKQGNAEHISASFQNCRTLGNATVTIKIEEGK